MCKLFQSLAFLDRIDLQTLSQRTANPSGRAEALQDCSDSGISASVAALASSQGRLHVEGGVARPQGGLFGTIGTIGPWIASNPQLRFFETAFY